MSNQSTPNVSLIRVFLDWWKSTKKSRNIEACTLLMILGVPLASVMAAIRSGSITLFVCSLGGVMALWLLAPRFIPNPRVIFTRWYEYHDESLPIINTATAAMVAASFPELKSAIEIMVLIFVFMVLTARPQI